MKKIILAMCILGICTTAYAACNGGTELSGFCVSNIGLNWWSAAAWCQANGMSLATMYDVCPDWDGNTGSGKCPILGGSNWGWTATVSGNSYVFNVFLNTGSVNSISRTYNFYALCK